MEWIFAYLLSCVLISVPSNVVLLFNGTNKSTL